MDIIADIDLPGVKEILWHQMHADLKSLVPWFSDHELLLCPTCFRLMKFDELSVEHIIPKQALDDDPKAVREAIIRNQRSGITLLCRKPLVVKEKLIKGNGCNGWKGHFFDGSARKLLRADPHKIVFTSRHQVSMFAIGYLALFRKYGYRVALSPSGLLMRRQFFCPDYFLKEVPLNCQMILSGPSLTEFNEQNKTYWDEPFKNNLPREICSSWNKKHVVPPPVIGRPDYTYCAAITIRSPAL
jgi:hypothetical protein